MASEADVTLRDIGVEARTIREPSGDESFTVLEGDSTIKIASSRPAGVSGLLESFRGWPVLEQLPTKGAEADIYLVLAGDSRCVLKLYRHRLEPKLEILNRITEISRSNSQCFVTFYETGFDETTGRWFELQEYMPHGSLRDLSLATKRTPLFIGGLVSELAESIHCLHENDVIHCDIKPANVLVRSLEPLDLVLTDFGISSLLASDESQKMTSLKGTPMYWAPEAFSRLTGRPCDWWGLGMMVLELLMGEHPLEGLSDSQIIHKLTLGNVEVPGALDQAWAMLVKGLLTKDDGRRWGNAEVVRWLSGERDIPVYYEERTAVSEPVSSSRNNPFRFEGTDYHTPEELARVFAVNEKPWLAGSNYLRYVRQWYESNLRFDDAHEIGDMIGFVEPELVMFRFINKNTRCPFSLLGRVVDANNLHLFLGRVIRRDASMAEDRIVEMMRNGRLIAFYDEYASLSGERDQFFADLLLFMNDKPLEEQWGYFEALNDPDSHIWPDGADLATVEGRLESVKKLGAVPMRRDALTSITESHILPSALVSMLHSPEAYASCVERIGQWKKQGLLIQRDSAEFSSLYEDMSVEDYARAARIHCLGHTQAILEDLDYVTESLRKLTPPDEYVSSQAFVRMIVRVDELRDQRINQWDSRFIIDTAELFRKRERLGEMGLIGAISTIAGGLCGLALLWYIHSSGITLERFITRFGIFLMPAFIFLVIITAVGLGAPLGQNITLPPVWRRGMLRRMPAPIAFYAILMIMIAFSRFAKSIWVPFASAIGLDIAYVTAFLAGSIPGYALFVGLRRFALFRNRLRIEDACSPYYPTMTQGMSVDNN
ncbi:MAG: protein kinase [Synergistaceae bacterium]|jgi:serine/threonine protein kinase|nr:protein kinase [Synergistaceae bacterium]